MRCVACECGDLDVFFESLQVPVCCNFSHDTPAEARSVPRGDIRLGYCRKCGMIHNVAFDEKRVEYTVGYENSLHGSARFQEFAEKLAQRLVDKYDLHGVDVFEIGPGRGEFLDLLCRAGGNRGVGYDPSAPEEDAEVPGRPFRIVRELFDPEHTRVQARLVCSRHVLEHVSQPRAFAEMLGRARSHSPDVAVYVEVPNALWTLRDLGVWDIIYEHCSYFTPTSLYALMVAGGLGAVSVREEFGGQFLSIETESGTARDEVVPPGALAELTRLVEAFGDRYRQELSGWNRRLAAAGRDGRRLAIWGGGAKGVTFLNSVDDPRAVACVVDINPRKQGKFVAGTGLPIVGPEEALRDHRVSEIIVVNPFYLDEIRTSVQGLGFTGAVRGIDDHS
ncbi:MAG: class I SAM-dependent methyltransferase [Planctomycetota bacterium]